MVKHKFHIGYTAHVSLSNRLIEGNRVAKHTLHISYPANLALAL